ncbi:MAG: ribonuclease R [Desulfobulbaceae bacterium]|nr:ribonuclease R [Desulfobulbaceae bacterium]
MRDEKNSELENILLSVLYKAETPLPFAKLQGVSLSNSHGPDEIKAALDSLTQADLVSKNAKNHFKLHKNALLYEGTLVQHPKGFGFVNVTKSPNNNQPLKRDPFLSPGQMGNAHHGDKLLIRVFRIRSDDRPESTLVKILSHGKNRIGGIYTKNGREQLVYPDDRRFPFTIKINDTGDLQPKNGNGVIVEFERANRPAKFLQGKIIEVLGTADAVDTQMRLVIEQFDLPCQFNDEVVQETQELNETTIPEQHREDLRSTAHVTIDGESAKDFDDAICVIKTRKGYRLFVSIADVSHFVTPGSAIDREAYARGTSIYFPGRVIPMLPEKLSNELCSLVPGEDRLTVSAILDFDRSGKLLAKRFSRSIIRSQHRFTYTTVQKILIDKDPAIRKEHKPFLTALKWADELATALQTRRKKRGSIDFDLPQPEFTLTDSGEIDSIKRTERNFAHQIIEEFMLAANEAVAELFSQQSHPALFRVHAPPESTKAEEFLDFAKTLGLPFAPFENKPAWFAEVLEKCKDTKYNYIINNLLLRSMQQAQYSAKNVGHFGLAAADYTHFTSPIRRYPDLIVHRELLRLLSENSQQKLPHAKQPSFNDSGVFLSARERTAIKAERDMNDRLKIGYMKKRIGDSFNAIISGVTENTLYVEVQELCISGSVPVEFLPDDYYIFDKKNYRLFGEITAKTYQIGDLIRVTVTAADNLSKRILFKLSYNSTG